MRTRRLYVVALVFFLGNSILTAQIVMNPSGAQIDPSINQETRDQIISGVSSTVQDYMNYCSLLDVGSGTVNSNSINRFYPLFDPSALLVKDYVRDISTGLIDINTYVSDMLTYLKDYGIRAEITDIKLKSITRDKADPEKILITVELIKTIENYYDPATGPGIYDRPVSVVLEMSLTTSTYFLEEILISQIARSSSPEEEQSVLEDTEVEPAGAIAIEDEEDILPEVPTSVVISNQLISISPQASDQIDEVTLENLQVIVTNAFNEYRAFATLFDKKSQQVTFEASERFLKLFYSRTDDHVSDIDQYQNKILDAEQYANRVFTWLNTTGVEYDLTEEEIVSVRYDLTGYHEVHVRAVKTMYAYLDSKDSGYNRYNKGYRFPIILTYNVFDGQRQAFLTKVLAANQTAAPEERVSQVVLAGNFDKPSVKLSPVLGQNWLTDDLEVMTSGKVGIGLEWRSNFLSSYRSQRKPVFFSIGARYNTFKLTSRHSGLSYSEQMATGDVVNQESIEGIYSWDIRNLEDNIRFNLIEIPIGFDYRIYGHEVSRLKCYIGVKAMPTYILSGTHEWSADPFYNLNLPQYGFSFYSADRSFNLNSEHMATLNSTYQIGNGPRSDAGTDIEPSLIIGYAVDLRLELALSAQFQCWLGASYKGYSGSLMERVSPDQRPFENRPDPGDAYQPLPILQEYFKEVNISALGLHVGLGYSLN